MGKKPAYMLLLFALFLFSYLLAWYLAARRRSADWNNLAGISALVAIGLLGFLVTHYRTAKTRPDNLLHLQGPVSYYVGVIDDYVSVKPGRLMTTLQLSQVKTGGHWRPVSGKVRLTLVRQKGMPPVGYGDMLLVKGPPVLVKPPANPAQFDYRRYLAYQQVYHQQYLYPGQYRQLTSGGGNPLVAASIRTRNYLDQQLRRFVAPEKEYGIATALILGIKDYLPEDIKTTYANTGTMHVLAVSGLHVALLFYVLNLLLGRWGQKPGLRMVSFLVLLGFIWFYAFITALSASVLRAVLMFSFIQAARTFRLPSNIYNTLAAAAFGLLLFNPYLLVDVGFQLSFLAVFGIVYLQPRIYRWLQVNSWGGDYTWKLVSTSLAAQLAVLPLSLYYFHQFPVYFLAANIVAVTLSNGALLLGFALLALSWIPVLAQGLGTGIAMLLQGMHLVGTGLLQLPGAVIKGISLSPAQTWLLYGQLGLLILFLVRKQLFYFSCFTGLWLWFAGLELVQARGRQKQELFVVYQVRGATALGFIREQEATLLADSAFYAQPRLYQYQVQPHWWQLGISKINLDTLAGQTHTGLAAVELPDGNVLIGWQGLRMLVCRQACKNYDLDPLNLDYVLLTRNAKLALESLPNKKPGFLVIMDGSDKTWYQNKWTTLLQGRRFRVYNVNRQGAYIQVVD